MIIDDYYNETYDNKYSLFSQEISQVKKVYRQEYEETPSDSAGMFKIAAKNQRCCYSKFALHFRKSPFISHHIFR